MSFDRPYFDRVAKPYGGKGEPLTLLAVALGD
jgi:hypothetical protein